MSWLTDVLGSVGGAIESAFKVSIEYPSNYGLKTFGKNGVESYSSNEVTWNLVDTFLVLGGSGLFKQYPIIHGKEVLVVQQLINAPPTGRRAIAHTVTVNDTVVGATGGSESAFIMVMMR